MSSLRRRQITFFVIIGLTLVFIGVIFLINRFFLPVQAEKAEATATAAAFYATVEAATGPDAVEVAGIPYVSLQPYTWDGLRIDIERVDYDAWPLVHLANKFNKQPPPGKRMIMITVAVSNVVGAEEVSVRAANFRVIGQNQEPYTTYDEDTRCGVIPQPLEGKVARGETVTGNICVVAPADEGDFLLEYRSNDLEKDPVYFALPE